jgi:hypothetical protein
MKVQFLKKFDDPEAAGPIDLGSRGALLPLAAFFDPNGAVKKYNITIFY